MYTFCFIKSGHNPGPGTPNYFRSLLWTKEEAILQKRYRENNGFYHSTIDGSSEHDAHIWSILLEAFVYIDSVVKSDFYSL